MMMMMVVMISLGVVMGYHGYDVLIDYDDNLHDHNDDDDVDDEDDDNNVKFHAKNVNLT